MRSFTYPYRLLSVLVTLIGAQAAVTFVSNLVVLESLPAVPQGWRQGVSVPAQELLRFRIALKQENAFAFEQHVIDISTPDHPKYGQHMKRDELKAMLRPSSNASTAVLQWLSKEHVQTTDVEDDGDWINFSVAAANAERMLNTKFYYYTGSMGKTMIIRTLRYSVPEKLHQYVQMIQPTTRFGEIRSQHSTLFKQFDIGPARNAQASYSHNAGFNATFCNSTITPDCLKYLYNFAGYESKQNKANIIGVGGFLKEYARYNDSAAFKKKYATYAENTTFEYVLINGGLNKQIDPVDDSSEGNVDVQYAYPLSYPARAIYYSTGGLGEIVPDNDQPVAAHNSNEPYLDFLHYLLALPDNELPTTLTISYGETEQSVPKPYKNQTCSLFAQLGARGVSTLFSSGDTGVGSACQTNDGKNATRFLPEFPASCPFVTAVGATYHVEPERAVAFSSGGFSDFFPRPTYQDAAVKQYLGILGDRWTGLYNPEGRGIPDVAAQGYNFTVIDQGRQLKVGGTSAAVPTFAAVISLLNGERISSGKPPLGFLNPFIYSVGFKGLNDIDAGGSNGCNGKDQYSGLKTPIVRYASWNATQGWDPVTGYGTPNFRKLLAISRHYHRRQGAASRPKLGYAPISEYEYYPAPKWGYGG